MTTLAPAHPTASLNYQPATFQEFAKLMHDRYTELAKNELFIVGTNSRAVFDAYLAAFPEGTNLIYKTNIEHDCLCCKNFICHLGNVVAIVDGKMETVWDITNAPYPYDIVAKQMHEYIRLLPITSIFRTTEYSYGVENLVQRLEDGTTKRWNHFHGAVNKKHRTAEPGTAIGGYNASVQVLRRGLIEFTPEHLDAVVDLINANGIYRGTEHLPSLLAFQKARAAWVKLDAVGRELFVWVNASAPYARFRNTVIGTLLVDLAEGKDLEHAVKSFEVKVAPTNYKRPTALITPGMVKTAMATLAELGLEPALERRPARISDVSINNVLWVDNSVQAKMKNGIENLLMGVVATNPTKDVKTEAITVTEFMERVLPTATSISVLVKNTQQGNFMSLTAPVHADSGKLFKWTNDFAWSYDGNIADSLRQRVASAGGRVDGVLRFSHSWNHIGRNASLMDLHVFLPGSSPHRDGKNDGYPSGQRVGWNNRNDHTSGGVQDVDYTSAAPEGYIPVENITFPSMSRLKDGLYTFKIHNWALRSPTTSGFKAEIEFDGQVFEYEHTQPLGQKEWVTVAEATLKNGKFTIEHKLSSTASSQEKWGIQTETFVKVNTLMLSPNYWDDNAVGNKHWFFVLDGCKNDSPMRGIYNEFLNSGLEAHRKVFEILGDKTKCQPTDDQLSGLGFSSTRTESVIARVTSPKGTQTFKINF